MTMTGRTLQEYLDMGGPGMVALVHFAKCLGPGSMTKGKEHEGMGEWGQRFMTNALLADLYDAIQGLAWTTAAKGSKKRPKKPKPYPRPWLKAKKQKFGKDPVPLSKFWDWWNSN
jgi:hypothetical protein